MSSSSLPHPVDDDETRVSTCKIKNARYEVGIGKGKREKIESAETKAGSGTCHTATCRIQPFSCHPLSSLLQYLVHKHLMGLSRYSHVKRPFSRRISLRSVFLFLSSALQLTNLSKGRAMLRWPHEQSSRLYTPSNSTSQSPPTASRHGTLISRNDAVRFFFSFLFMVPCRIAAGNYFSALMRHRQRVVISP